MNALPPSCTTTLDCASPLLLRIIAALETSAVKDALAAHTVFGVDSRPVDGQVFRVRLAAAYFDVGSPCGSGSSACKTPPASVQSLVDDLKAVDVQELAKKPCTNVFGPP